MHGDWGIRTIIGRTDEDHCSYYDGGDLQILDVKASKLQQQALETDCKRSELRIDATSAKILPASDSEYCSRRGGVRLAHRDPSGER